jgi:glucose/mannose transport system substrate-binding protein
MKILRVSSFLVLAFLLAAGAAFAGGAKESTTMQGGKQFLIYDYWTAGGEKQAIDALFDMFRQQQPGVQILENQVAGGGGSNMLAVLIGKLQSHNPPDAFQASEGSQLKDYADAGYLDPVDDIWQASNMASRINPMWIKTVKFNGHYWTVPLNAHRTNWLWYNKKIFDQLNLTPPTDFASLLADAKAIKQAMPNVSPIALGTAEKVWSIYLMDMCDLLTGGPQFLEKVDTGLVDFATDPTFRQAMENYASLIPYIYPYSSTKTWDQAAALLKTGDAAMYWMGDWVLGYFLSTGMKPEVDFSAVAIPSDVWMGHADTFPMPKGAPHPELAKAWLNMLTTADAQKAFNMIKGSVTIVKDVPASVYPDPYRKLSAADLQSKLAIPDGFHGGLMTANFGGDLMNILTQFLSDSNVDNAISAIAAAAARDNLKQNSAWYWAQ